MHEAIPRVTVSEHAIAYGDTLHISVLSDLHVDNSACDYSGLKAMCAARAALPNHVAVGLGDLCDLVMPPDLRRFRQSGQVPEVASRDDWFRGAVEYVGERLAALGLTWAWIARGNHEEEALKRHGWDATSVLAAHLKCRPAGYSGVHDFRLMLGPRKWVTFRMVYHHGAWGGALAKGFNSAVHWANAHDGWNVAVWGHNHASRVDPEVRLAPDPHSGTLRERRVYLVACGSWVHGQSPDGSVTAYTERHGYRPQPRQSPLIKVKLAECGGKGPGRHTGAVYSVEV